MSPAALRRRGCKKTQQLPESDMCSPTGTLGGQLRSPKSIQRYFAVFVPRMPWQRRGGCWVCDFYCVDMYVYERQEAKPSLSRVSMIASS